MYFGKFGGGKEWSRSVGRGEVVSGQWRLPAARVERESGKWREERG